VATARRTRAPIESQRGQSTVEWAILGGLLVIALVVVMGAFPEAIGRYYRNVSSVLALPVP
jgi:hypothetical protein